MLLTVDARCQIEAQRQDAWEHKRHILWIFTENPTMSHMLHTENRLLEATKGVKEGILKAAQCM